VAHPRTVLVLWAIVTIVPLGGLLRLRRETDGRAMAPRGDAAVRIDAEVRERFGLRDPLIVFFDTGRPNGIFDAGVLAAVAEVSDRIVAMPEFGRTQVMSLRTEARDRLFPGWSETYRDFLTPPPRTKRQLDEVREDLGLPAARLYRGTIVTGDFSGTAIVVGVPEHGQADREEIYRRIAAVAAPFHAVVVGAPAAEATLATYILRDIVLLVPLSMAVIALVLWRGTRRFAPVAIALVKVGACIAWSFAILGWIGVPVYLTVAIAPVVLAAMCIADEIHVLTRFQALLRERASSPAPPVLQTFHEMATPVLAATLTTCAGFLACLPSRIAPVQALGAVAAIGIAYSLAFTLCVTPALLVLLPGRLFARRDARADAIHATTAFALRHRTATFAVAGVVTLLAIAGLSRLYIQDSWIDNFSRRAPFRRETDRVNERLFGVHRLVVHVSFAGAGAFTRPEVLRAIRDLETTLRARGDVGGVIGPSSQMETVADFWRIDRDDSETVLRRFDFAPGQNRRQRVLADGFSEGAVTIFLKNANYRDTAAVMRAVRGEHARAIEPLGGSIRFAGDVAVSQSMIPSVVRNQVLSLPLALAGVFAIVVLLCGSVRLALYAILPVAVSGLWLLGLFGAAGIPLGVGTSMFFVIALGLGVDSHSIHLVIRYRQLRDAGRALAEVTRPVVINTAAVAGGFGLMVFSSVPANRNLGLLIAAGLVLGAALTLTCLAALLAASRETRNREEDSLHETKVASPEWRMS
jgi:hypothetical protein